MTQSVALYQGAAQKVYIGGTSVIALYGPLQSGYIYNPSTQASQGLSLTEPLYVSFYGPATLGGFETTVTPGPNRLFGPYGKFRYNQLPYGIKELIEAPSYVVTVVNPIGPTTFVLQPGETVFIPENFNGNVWVNAWSSGHKFTAVAGQPPTQYPPTPLPATFPPSGPTNLQYTLPSYLYEEYKDDIDLQAFISTYNAFTQAYVTWFNTVNLPIYTVLSGQLLDWVGAGLYGYSRPTLYSYKSSRFGPYNTWRFGRFYYNERKTIGVSNIVATSDDVYKRCLTWHLYKGDGKQFTVRWLKRRVARFLYGINGTDYNGPTYQISGSFGIDNITITIVGVTTKVTGGAFYGNRSFLYGRKRYSEVDTASTNFDIPPMAYIFQDAITSGALEMPFEYTINVDIGAA